MSSIFLRIYGGLLFSLVLVSVLSGITITIVNGVRLSEYREDMASGTFRLLSESLATKPLSQRQEWLASWSHKLDIPFTLKKRVSTSVSPEFFSEFSPEEGEYFESKEVLVQMQGEELVQVTTAIDDQWLLQAQLPEISEEMVLDSLALLRELLLKYPDEDRDNKLKELSHSAFNYPVSLISARVAGFQPLQNQQLAAGGILMLLDDERTAMLLYARMPDSGQLIRMGPVPLLSSYPFRLMLTIVLFVLVSLSLAIYILVRGMEKRLRKLERAATRFSRGDFEVRVEVGGTDSIGRLAVAFNAMAGHIQRLLGLQKEMIRGVSHELRTPVARLRFGLDLIADAETQEERESQLEGMDQDIEELDKLVDEFLTYANLEQAAPTLQLKRHDVDKVVAQVVGEHMRLQDRVDIEHLPCNKLDPRRFVEIDRRYIHRAIQNLVGNACRYAEGKVQISFSSTQDTCRIDVDDDGPGIPESQRERVFSAFSRLDDSRTRKSGGYGLGLSIVRRIMYWHNGRAMVSHSPLGGARFSLVWPRKQH